MDSWDIVELLTVLIERVEDISTINWAAILVGAVVQLLVGLAGVYVGYRLGVRHSMKRERLGHLREAHKLMRAISDRFLRLNIDLNRIDPTNEHIAAIILNDINEGLNSTEQLVELIMLIRTELSDMAPLVNKVDESFRILVLEVIEFEQDKAPWMTRTRTREEQLTRKFEALDTARRNLASEIEKAIPRYPQHSNP